MRTIILLLGMLVTSALYAGEDINAGLIKAAKETEVPVELLKAICIAESKLNTQAYVYADGGENNHAFGACQVLLKTAESFGLKNHGCDDNFSYRKEDRTYKNCKLFGAYTNALYAAKYLKYQLDRYDGSWINATAAYNSGTVKLCKYGHVKNVRGEILYKCKKGGLLNQVYVDRVMKVINKQDPDYPRYIQVVND